MEGSDRTFALRVRGVSKSFGGVHAVRRVDVTVLRGERRALIGPNGAGKSTLFNLIAGEMKADEGSIEVFGVDVTQESVGGRARLGLGRTYQISQLFPVSRSRNTCSWEESRGRGSPSPFCDGGRAIARTGPGQGKLRRRSG